MTATNVVGRPDLFRLDWVAQPEAALEQAKVHGISDRHFIEMSAWCAELHAQLAELAESLDLPLLLMGGNAAALRLEAASQRGSRDNDYLTTATEADIFRLMDALVARFEPHFAKPLFRYRQLKPEDADPLPLLSFMVDVPALLDRNAPAGVLGVKLEFHIEDDPSMFPEHEQVSGRFVGLTQDLLVRIPRLPYQIGLKFMTLHAPPIGVEAGRQDVLLRQLYDLDVLLAQLSGHEEWATLASYSERRYEKEAAQRGLAVSSEGPWTSIAERLDQWSDTEEADKPYGASILRFQASQLASRSTRPLAQWSGRVRRLQFAVRCLALGKDGYQLWVRALDIEARIAEPAGPRLKGYRKALADVVGKPARSLGQFPRVPFWAHLAVADDLGEALEALDHAL